MRSSVTVSPLILYNLDNYQPNNRTDRSLQVKKTHSLLKQLLPRLSSCTSRTVSYTASLTLEAAAVVPLFLIAVLQLVSIFSFYQAQARVTASLHQTGKSLAQYAYLYEDETLRNLLSVGDDTDAGISEELAGLAFSETYVRGTVTAELGQDYLEHSPILGGALGIIYGQSRIMEEELIDLVGVYTLKPPVGLVPMQLRCMSRARIRAWTGYDNESASEAGEEEDPYVYIAENPTVYHTDRNCSYIQISIQAVAAGDVEECINAYGENYTACWRCRNETTSGAVFYITEDGNRYHTSVECGAIRRTIQMVHLSEVGNLPCCSRCAA